MSDAVERAAEVIAPIIANATACGYDPKGTCGTCRADSALIAQALADAGLLVTPGHDAAVAAKAWGEGFATGQSRAMRHMSDEPLLPLSAPNPYRREAGESDADA